MTKLQHLIERMSSLMTPLQKLKQCEIAKVRHHHDPTKKVWIISRHGRGNTSTWAYGYDFGSEEQAQDKLNSWIQAELEDHAWREATYKALIGGGDNTPSSEWAIYRSP